MTKVGLCSLMLAAGALFASDNILNVTALDATRHPVTDLASADLRVFDAGKPQRIASFKASTAPPTTLILFDLLNLVPRQRVYASSIIIRALEPLETQGSVYLYLLTNAGELYPVHGLPPAPAVRLASEESGKPSDASWTRQIHPLLDRAIQNVYGLMPEEDKDTGIRTAMTFQTLGQLGEQLTKLPGPKTIVWISSGVWNRLSYPYGCKDVMFPGTWGGYLAGKCGIPCYSERQDCIYYTPFLQHFSATLNRAETLIYGVQMLLVGALAATDPGKGVDTFQQLANLTGGRAYLSGEVEDAITRSLADARARYQLTYEAPPPDGKYHELRVTCTRKGVRIEAQRGYYSSQP